MTVSPEIEAVVLLPAIDVEPSMIGKPLPPLPVAVIVWFGQLPLIVIPVPPTSPGDAVPVPPLANGTMPLPARLVYRYPVIAAALTAGIAPEPVSCTRSFAAVPT